MMRVTQEKFYAFLISGLVLTGCGSNQPEPEANGVLTRINDQTVVLKDKVQQAEICKTNFCEPNYIVHEAFARRRPASTPTPAPTASPNPNATATPVPTPVLPADLEWGKGDKYDYSRTVMNLRDAWSVTQGDPEVIVAIIDSGVDLKHPDLVGNLWTNEKELNGVRGKDNDGNGYADDVHGYDFYSRKGDPTDQTGHGTHCAGIIAAIRNGMGSVGVAPKVKVMPLRFIGADGAGDTADAIDAIYYAIKMGARVISASWGGSGYSTYLAKAIQDAQAAGIVFVAAAGNNSQNTAKTPYYPGSYPGVISVAASDEKDKLASYSNYGTAVTIAAPGSNIYSTYLDQGYEYLSGTSMAGPQVAGAIALALSKNKSTPAAQVAHALCVSSDNALKSSTQCGRMNVGNLLRGI